MSNITETKAQPIYRIYSVHKSGEKKSVWQEIGAAWKHKDGKGLGVQCTACPLGDAQIVLREPKTKRAAAA